MPLSVRGEREISPNREEAQIRLDSEMGTDVDRYEHPDVGHGDSEANARAGRPSLGPERQRERGRSTEHDKRRGPHWILPFLESEAQDDTRKACVLARERT